jgi:hypothetical protein
MKLPNGSLGRIERDLRESFLGDERRTARLVDMGTGLARAPQASLPTLLRTEARLEGAYRLLNNGAVEWTHIFEGHRTGTMRRAREEAGPVLVIHDTTTCSFPHLSGDEVGYLSTGKPGFYVHVSLAVVAGQRRPLGVVAMEPYSRAQPSGRGSRSRHVSGAETGTWTDREYLRWSRGVDRSAKLLSGRSPVHIMDRESDSYALFDEMITSKQRFVVRARVDRKLADQTKLTDALESCEGVFDREVSLSARKASSAPRRAKALPERPSRVARLKFKATQVSIARPRSCDSNLPDEQRLNVVEVQESSPPPGQQPVHWTLWTTEPVTKPAQVVAIVDMYRQRWLVEELFKALKTGCAYEARYLQSQEALLNMLAVSIPVAVELLWLRARASDEGAPASDVLSPTQLKILRKAASRPLSDEPTAAEALLAIAGLVGHQKNNGAPGWLILKRGFEQLLSYEVGWNLSRTKKM